MDFSSLHKDITQHSAELEALVKEFRGKMQAKFDDLIKSFFVECPRVQAVVWSQYTPYFNDGEECTFSINEIYFIENGFDPEELEDPYHYEEADLIETISEWHRSYYTEKFKQDPTNEYYAAKVRQIEKLDSDDGTAAKCEMLRSVLNSNQDLLQEIFGDHMAVYLTPDGSITREYSHD